jgi:hypothetical protein
VVFYALPPAEPQAVGRHDLGHPFIHQGGLANAGLTRHQDHLADTLLGLGPALLERGELGIAPDEQPRTHHWHCLEGLDHGWLQGCDRGSDRGDKPIAPPAYRLHILRCLRRIAQGLTQLADAHRQGRVTHVP